MLSKALPAADYAEFHFWSPGGGTSVWCKLPKNWLVVVLELAEPITGFRGLIEVPFQPKCQLCDIDLIDLAEAERVACSVPLRWHYVRGSVLLLHGRQRPGMSVLRALLHAPFSSLSTHATPVLYTGECTRSRAGTLSDDHPRARHPRGCVLLPRPRHRQRNPYCCGMLHCVVPDRNERSDHRVREAVQSGPAADASGASNGRQEDFCVFDHTV